MNSRNAIRVSAGLGARDARRHAWFLPGMILAASFCILNGCALFKHDVVTGPNYRPANVHSSVELMPPTMRRVAVLPLTSSLTGQVGESGCETLQPVLVSELIKSRMFEIIPVTREQLKQWTGQREWTAEEKLPPAFFEKLRGSLSCDGVLFCRLTEYRPYPPMSIGWNMKLVDAQSIGILWAADEVFDSGMPTVVNAARRYYQSQLQEQQPVADSRSILNSPRRFGQYTVSAMLSTLPPRELPAKVSGKPADK